MISGVLQKRFNVCLRQVIAPDLMRGSKRRVQGAIARKLVHSTIGFATASLLTIAIAQAAVAQAAVVSGQHSTCAADAQGLMCNPSNREFEGDVVQMQATQASAASRSQPLSNAQMERVADILLGLLYFVLPVGFGVGLFWHDRQQAQRTATLEAQIKLLEKLWNQSPQA